MKAVILSLALFVALCSASPLTLERETEEKPLRVVDVPAGVFETPKSEDKETLAKDETTKVESIDDLVKDIEKVEPAVDKKKPVEGASGEEGTNVFGIRFPSILIIRRPPMFQDPFAGFQSPFFGGFNRRPIFAPPPFVDSGEQPERVNTKDRETVVGSDSKVDEQKINDTVLVNNVIQRMHQQFSNLFSNLFNPDAFNMQRPVFPQYTPQRPFFSRPSIFAPVPEESSEEEGLNFDKLPANYSNSTSETKLIDGQLVTVNKTVHKISGNNSNGFFHFSVINVRPNAPVVSPEAEKVPSAPVAVEVKPVESVSVPQSVATEEKPVVIGVGGTEAEMDPAMNEVDRADNNDKLPEVELKSTYEIKNEDTLPANNNGDELVEIVPIKSEKLIQASSKGKNVVNDLSSDIRVNNLMEANSQQARVRALFDPEEVEIFEV